jgi:hypothetical protein
MDKAPFFVFPNIQPTMVEIEKLGFVLDTSSKYDRVYFRDFNGVQGRLAIFDESATWDVSDNTWLEFRLGDTPFSKSPWTGSLQFEDGFQMGTRNVPTADQICDAIDNQITRDMVLAKDKLTAGYRALAAVHDEYLRTATARLVKW